ncbi:MAG: TrkA C-terminal domain-containing protein [Buchananella hordeovulneris]|nr:TrkA C-terminal domain-containing protein [Buchananella hordeovulneris]
MGLIFSALQENDILLLFLLLGVGMVFGSVKVKGIKLGAAAVLFAAMALTAWGQSAGYELHVNHDLGILGLALFAFAIGINAGPTFFNTLKTAVGPILAMIGVLVGAGALAWGVGNALGMSPALIGGTFAGAITNTPALSAAGQASGDTATATVGYSIAYLWGVFGMMIAAGFALSKSRSDKDAPSPLVNRTIRVERDDNPRVGDLWERAGGEVTFSRLRRGETGPIRRPKMEDTLDRDDLVTVVGKEKAVAAIIAELGHSSTHSLMADRSYLDFRRITVSDPKLAGRTISELDLSGKFEATISRVRRGDIDMVGAPTLVLQQGDRVRVVAPTGAMAKISKFFGDSAHGLSDINPVALGLGMALGILIGELPILTPSGDTFSIGSAAGTLLVGLVMGRIGRIGRVVTSVPYTTCMVLSEIGLLVFLAYAGTKAGSQITAAFTSGAWTNILLLGFLITSFVAAGIYLSMRLLFKMGGTRLAGVLGGTQTQPAVLAFANGRTQNDPRVALGYAMVYPVAMVGKILVAQVLGMM